VELELWDKSARTPGGRLGRGRKVGQQIYAAALTDANRVRTTVPGQVGSRERRRRIDDVWYKKVS